MNRLAYWCVFLSCYYSIFAGVMPYAFDINKRLAIKKTAITIYCIIVNILSVFATFFLYNEQLFNALRNEILQLHQVIFVIVIVIRIFAVLVALLLNWYYRDELIRILHGFARLRRNYFNRIEVNSGRERNYDINILWKFFLVLMSDALTAVAAMGIFWHKLDSQQLLRIAIIFMLTNIINLVSNQYYFGVLNINFLFHLMNDDIQRIVCTTKLLDRRQQLEQQQQQQCLRIRNLQRRRGRLATQCCTLSDQLDEIAINYRKLVALAKCFNDIYQWQGAAVVLTLYLNNIAIVYYLYKLLVSEAGFHIMDIGLVNVILAVLASLSYYANVLLFAALLIDTLDATAHGLALLQQQKYLQPLDVRLEESFNNIFIHFITNPFGFNLSGIFEFSKSLAVSTIGSTILHCIFLVQYDIKISNK